MLPEPIYATHQVTAAFEQLGIPYLIGGSLASSVHGMIRSTMDADLVADIQPGQVAALAELLEGEFYIDPHMIQGAIEHRTSFNLIHQPTMFKVDVFLLRQRPFDLSQMQRRISLPVGEGHAERAFFSTAEDIILAKLEWFRGGGETSERQWRDIQGVLHVQGGRLDFDYLLKWAGNLGVLDLWQKALNEIEGG